MKRNRGIAAAAATWQSSVVKSFASRVREEDNPISMFVSAQRAAQRARTFALFLAVLSGTFVAGISAVHAQNATPSKSSKAAAPPASSSKTTTPAPPVTTTPAKTTASTTTTPLPKTATPPTSRAASGSIYGGVPLLHEVGIGNGRYLPAGTATRSTKAPRFKKAPYTPNVAYGKSSRVQIGTGQTAVNVPEQVVNLTIGYTVPDVRTPFWTPQQTSIYYSSNLDPIALGNTIAANGRYHLFSISSAIPATLAGQSTPVPLNNPADTSDYLFPSVNSNGSYITFIRSSDGKAITDSTKTWVLCYAPVPASGSYIDPAATTVAGGPTVTFPNAAGNSVTFANVQRPTWLGSNNIIFSGILAGDTSYHLFQANLQPTAGQSILFQLTAGSADERNPAMAPDGKTLAFDSNALPVIGTGGTEAYGAAGLPRTVALPSNVPTSATAVNTTTTNGAVNRNIFTMNLIAISEPGVAGGVLSAYTVRQYTERFTGAIDVDNVEPAWSSLNTNQYSNPGGGATQNEYLSWASGREPTFDPTDTTDTVITGYTANALHHLYFALVTTNDGSTITPEGAPATTNGATYLDTGDSITSPQFDDHYPTWSPFLTAFQIAFQSDRNGDYFTDYFDGYVPTGQTTNSFSLTQGRNSLFVATVIDTTAPSLIRFDLNSTTGEIVHINQVTNTNEPFDPTTSVRNSDDGVVPGSTIHFAVRVEDRQSGMRPDKAVFLQIKNPNSKYQSMAQGSTIPAEHKEYRDPDVFNGPPWTLWDSSNGYWPYETNKGNDWGTEYEAEAIGITNNITTIGGVLVNTGAVTEGSYFGHLTPAQGGNNLGKQRAGSSASAANDVLYEAGQSDQAAFSGTDLVPLDGSGGQPAVWLELKPLYQFDASTGNPILDASGNPVPWLPTDLGSNQPAGGVLYGASLKLPQEPSDWYIDVILYDNAVNPFDTTEKYNVIIYDNVWGFSSAPPITPQPSDILVVSDYALGQKFFNSRFAELQQTGAANNLLPIDFGSESYFTDVDVNKFFDGQSITIGTTVYQYTYTPNTLGVKTYDDGLLQPFASTVDREPLTNFSHYELWRILSRGPLTTNVLNSFLPTQSTRPPDVYPNPANNAPFETAAQPVVNAQRLVVWNSPFSGDLYTGEGTIVDTQTQNNLQSFVNAGGRLFLSGQDVAYALTSNGAVSNPFLTNVLQVKFLADESTTGSITPAGDTGGLYTERIENEPWTASQHGPAVGGNLYLVNPTDGYDPPGSGPIPLTANVDTQDGDAAFTVVLGENFGSGDVVTVAPTTANSSNAMYNHGGNEGLTVSEYGSGVSVFASYGFETTSQDWYTFSVNSTSFLAVYGRRTELMHNIACALRSGTIIGQIISSSGQPVAGALVRAVLGAETTKASGTAISDSSGNYAIYGLQPDGYSIYAYENGYYSQHVTGSVMHGTGTAQVNLTLKSANPGSISGFPITAAPAGNNGGVFESDGKTPLQGITVQVLELDLTNGAYDIVAASTTSGVNGSYSLPSVPIGNYVIVANPATNNKNYDPNVATVEVTATPSAGFQLSTGETVNANNTVTIAENTSFFVNFFLAASPQVVTGLVESSASGNPPIPGAVVSATLSGSTTVVATATTNANGAYTLTLVTPAAGSSATAIPAGTYVLTVTKTGYASATATIIVGGNSGSTLTVPTIYLTQLPPGTVQGEVTVPSGQTVSAAAAAGATVSLYPIITVNGVQEPDTTATPLTATVSATVTTGSESGYDNTAGVTETETISYNYVINNVPAGAVGAGNEYIAIVTPAASSGLTASPTQQAVLVFTGTTTFNVNFELEPPHTYAAGLDLISLPGNYTTVPDPAGIFGITPLGDNNGTGMPGSAANIAIYDAFNVAEWTGTEYVINSKIIPEPGKGYFVRFPISAGIVELGTPITSSSFIISLTNGWNLIGNPFNDQSEPTIAAASLDITNPSLVTYSYTSPSGAVRANVPLSTAVADGAVGATAYSYTGSANGSQYIESSLLQGYNGYWFLAYVPVQMNLTYPGSASTTSKAQKPVAINGVYRTITSAEANATTPMRPMVSKSLTSWQQRISITQGALMDSDNSIAVRPDASAGWDNRYDTQKPPAVQGVASIRLAIAGTDSTGRAADLQDRALPPVAGIKTWNLTVTSSATSSGPITVTWPNIDQLPSGIAPVLVDVATGRRIAMRNGASSYTFQPTKTGTRSMQILVAPPASLPLDIVNLRSSHTRSAGVGSTFRFNFTSTRDAAVQTQIITLAGRVMRTLTGQASAGADTTIAWDGKNEVGGNIPAGPYVVDIKVVDTNGEQVERKVIFMSLQ